MARYNGELFYQDAANLYRQNLENQMNQQAEQNAQKKTGGLLDGLFSKLGAIGNTFSTTGAAMASPFVTAAAAANTNSINNDSKKKKDEIFRKYGYDGEKGYNAQFNGLSAEEDEALANSLAEKDKAMWDEIRELSTGTMKKLDENGKNFKNNAVVKKINNTDRYKFAGDSIQTLSTAADIMLPGIMSSPLANAVQGGIEGFAQELSENGENLSLEDALKNAAVGTVGGAVTGGIGNKLKAPKSLLGSAVRGAELGAIGGAVSGGANVALNQSLDPKDILNGTLQGAAQGAATGGLYGTAMPIVNKAISKTPGVSNLVAKIQAANTDALENGAKGALKRAWQSGDSSVANHIKQGNVNTARTLKELAEGVSTLANRGANTVDNAVSNIVKQASDQQASNIIARNPQLAEQIINQADDIVTRNYNTERLPDIANAIQNGVDNNMDGFLMRNGVFEDANGVRIAEGKAPWSNRQTTLYAKRTGAYDPNNPISGHYMKHADQLGGAEGVTAAMRQTLDGNSTQAYPTTRNQNTNLASLTANNGFPASTTIDENMGVKSISPRSVNQIKNYTQQKDALPGGSLGGGNRSTINIVDNDGSGFPVSARQATGTNISQNGAIVNNRNVLTGKQIKSKREIGKLLMDQFYAVDKPTARATKPNETFYNIYNEYGLSDGDQIRQAVSYAEPGNLVPKIIREAAGQAGVIDLSDAKALVMDLKLNKKQNYKKTVDILEDIIDSTPSTITGDKSGVDALELQRVLEQMASDAKGTNGTYHIGNNVVDQTTAKNLSRIAKNIGESLDKAAIQNGAVEKALGIYSKEIQEMRNAFPGNQKWQARIDNDIVGATTIKQLRSSIKDLTRASMYIHSGDENYATFGGRHANSLVNLPTSKSGVTNSIINMAANKLKNSEAVRQYQLNQLNKQVQGGAEVNTADTPIVTQNQSSRVKDGIKNVVSNVTGLDMNLPNFRENAENAWPTTRSIINSARDVINSKVSTNDSKEAEYENQQAELANQLSDLDEMQAYSSQFRAQNTENFANPNQAIMEELQSVAKQALAMGDIKAFSEAATLYDKAEKMFGSNTQTAMDKLSATEKGQFAKLETAANAIDRLENLFNKAGGGQGIIGGGLQNLAASLGMNSDVSTYNQLAQGLINQISAAVGKTDSLNNEGEVARALDLIPKITDDAQTAQNKLNELRKLLSDTKKSYAAVYNV